MVLTWVGAILPSALAEGATPKTFTLEQPALGMPLALVHEGRTKLLRLDLPMVTETVVLSAGRSVALLESDDIPARLESPSSSEPVTVVFRRAETKALPTGKAVVSRELQMRFGDHRVASVELQYELDLLGLASEQPQISVTTGKVVAFSMSEGLFEGASIARPTLFASPMAQLDLTRPSVEVRFKASGHNLEGNVVLGSFLTPEAFRSDGHTRLALRLYSGASGSKAMDQALRVEVGEDTELWTATDASGELQASIVWTKDGANGAWRGRLFATLAAKPETAPTRASLVLGDQDSAYPIHSAGAVTVTERPIHASADTGRSTSAGASLRP